MSLSSVSNPALQDAIKIFDSVFQNLQEEYGRENLHFPKEILWLGGAPGSGKGTNTPFIIRERGIASDPIVMSTLLDSEEMQALKAKGRLIGDVEVVSILFRELLKPEYSLGVVVDGFPRTKVRCRQE